MQRRQKIINNINKFLKFLDLRVSNQSNADEVLKFINRSISIQKINRNIETKLSNWIWKVNRNIITKFIQHV